MKIFYWAPWLGKVGSVKSVMNSANILEKYSKNHTTRIRIQIQTSTRFRQYQRIKTD